MRRDVRLLLFAFAGFVALAVLVICTLVLTNVDYAPVVGRIPLGAHESEVKQMLAEFSFQTFTLEDGRLHSIRVQEPDIWPSYTYDLFFQDGILVRKKGDL